jgi:predicted ATPase
MSANKGIGPRVQKIAINGFRSLKNVDWEPDSLNVVIGPNGSGKSNLLRALEILRESARGKLRDAVLAEGGIIQLLWDHRASEISWMLNLKSAAEKSRKPESLTYNLALRPAGLGGGFAVARESLAHSGSPDLGGANKRAWLIERDPARTVTWDARKRKLLPPPQTIPSDETVVSASSIFAETRILAFSGDLASFCIYHDLVTHRGAPVREAAVARVETSLSRDGQNLVPVLHTLYTGHRDFKRLINAGMRAAFTEDFEDLEFGPAADQRIQLRLRWKSLADSVSAADLSDGTLRFLMLLTVLANPQPGAFLAIDEPETGLHPRMFPIIAELAASASEHSTVVLTTHSAEFLDAFPADCVPTTTVAECVDGETRLSKLDPHELKRWLKEYSLGRLFSAGDLEALS